MRTLLGVLLLSLTLLSPSLAAEVHLSVAASMTDATKELIATYEKQSPGVSFLPNFASSGALAKQIAQGAPADIFISANPKWMTYLVDEKRISADRVRIFALNTLVFIGKKDLAINSLADVARLHRIAIGSPRSVPAGEYAEQALLAAGIYEQMKRKLVMAQDVRQALVYSDRGETDGAFVYRTDALLAKEAVILLEVPPTFYNEVTYPIGLTIEGGENPEAVAFYEYLESAAATEILKKFGFVMK